MNNTDYRIAIRSELSPFDSEPKRGITKSWFDSNKGRKSLSTPSSGYSNNRLIRKDDISSSIPSLDTTIKITNVPISMSSYTFTLSDGISSLDMDAFNVIQMLKDTDHATLETNSYTVSSTKLISKLVSGNIYYLHYFEYPSKHGSTVNRNPLRAPGTYTYTS